ALRVAARGELVVAGRRIHRDGPARLIVEEARTADRQTSEPDVVDDHAVGGNAVVELRRRAQALHARFDGEVSRRRAGAGARVARDADLDHLQRAADWQRAALEGAGAGAAGRPRAPIGPRNRAN